MNKPTIVITMLGASGIGKSTNAALVFGELKRKLQSVELVREFVKEWVWAGKKVGPFGQSIIYGQQIDRESSLYNKVDFIVTDSPLILCPVYQMHYEGHDSIKYPIFKDLETAKSMNVHHMNFFLKRTKPFNPNERYEDEETARLIDKKLESFLIYNNIDYIVVDCPEDNVVKFVLEKALEYKEKLSEVTNV